MMHKLFTQILTEIGVFHISKNLEGPFGNLMPPDRIRLNKIGLKTYVVNIFSVILDTAALRNIYDAL